MANSEQATGIHISPREDHSIYMSCITGRISQSKFLEVKERGMLIHSGMCEQVQTKTPKSNRYFLTLVDDYSWLTVVRLMKCKTKVIDAIKDYVATMGNRFGENQWGLDLITKMNTARNCRVDSCLHRQQNGVLDAD